MKRYLKMIAGAVFLIVGTVVLLGRAFGNEPIEKPENMLQEKGATLFVEGLINTAGDEYGPVFTADGKTLYFVKRVNRRGAESIFRSEFNGTEWSAPEMMAFSSNATDKEPYLSQDGTKLFFASKRLVNGANKDFDIWMVTKTGDSWGEAQNLTAVNSDVYDNYPAVAANGNLYFSSHREGGKGANDLWLSKFVNGTYTTPVNLTSLNTPNSDADPFIAPDESYMIMSTTRPGGRGQGDLYITYNRNGHWSEPVTLGDKVNTDDYEYTPFVTRDGKYLFFSRGWGDIYFIEMAELDVKK